jgi:hypothetical protein
MHYRLASDGDSMVIVGLVPRGTTDVVLVDSTAPVEAMVNSDYGVFILSGSAMTEVTSLELIVGAGTISCDVAGRQLRDLSYLCE